MNYDDWKLDNNEQEDREYCYDCGTPYYKSENHQCDE